MDVKIIFKNYQKEQLVTYSLWVYDICDRDVCDIGNKHNAYRCENCMKKFWESLTEHAVKTINLEKKKVMLLTNEQ